MTLILFSILYIYLGTYFYFNRKVLTQNLGLILGVKILIALLYIYLYENVFSGNDLEAYTNIIQGWKGQFNNGKTSFYELLFRNKGIEAALLEKPRVIFFSKVMLVLRELSFQNIYISAAILSIINFTFWIENVKLFKKINPKLEKVLLLTLMIPSLLFWSSGLNKEAICLPMAIYLMLFIYQIINNKANWAEVPLALITLYLIWNLRYFYLPPILLSGIIYAGLFYFKEWKYWLVIVLGSLLILGFQSYLPYPLRLENFSRLVYQNYHLMTAISDEGKYMEIVFPSSDLGSILRASIISLKGSFHMVFFNLFSSLQSIENSAFLVGIIGLLVQWKKILLTKEIIAILCFVLISAMLINLVSPNYGSLSRYKVIYWFWLGFLLNISFFFKKHQT